MWTRTVRGALCYIFQDNLSPAHIYQCQCVVMQPEKEQYSNTNQILQHLLNAPYA